MDHHNHHHHHQPDPVTTIATAVLNIDNMEHTGHHNMMNMSTTAMPNDMGGMKDMGGMGGMDGMSGHHDHDHGMDMNMNGSECSGGMMMYFHTGNCEYILFEALYTTKVGHIVAASVVMFFLALLYEGLKYGREVLVQKTLSQNKYITTTLPAANSQENMIIQTRQAVTSQMLSCGHFIQTLLHMVQVFVSYCLMLVFMTYNVWLCLAIILGAGAGYFIFGWRRAVIVDVNEHCH